MRRPAVGWSVHSLISDVFVLPRRLRTIELISRLIYDATGTEGWLSVAAGARFTLRETSDSPSVQLQSSIPKRTFPAKNL
jgi:hypothetical protein